MLRACTVLTLLASQLNWVVRDAGAQEYPSRPIKIIISVSAGGAIDIFLRALGTELQKRWGQPIIIESRPGGNFLIAARACAESPPDGYTLCALTPESLVQGPLLYKNAGYSSSTAFAPISQLFYNTLVWAVYPEIGVTSFRELADTAKKKPLAFAYITLANRILIDRFNKVSGTDIVPVPTRGGSDVLNGLITGNISVGVASVITFLPQVQDRKLVPIVIDGIDRSPLLPDVPTLAEVGFPGTIVRNYWGLVAPRGVPEKIVDQLQKAVREVANQPEFKKQQIIDRGLEPILSSPQQFSAFLLEDTAAFVELMKENSIRPQ